mmetsp:Transcript_46700/g.91197  ORF Transcript_46700/g.91197 Transcript_46700/m.91197 type:complete len:93 (-) Transcript_46700:483-761(-)
MVKFFISLAVQGVWIKVIILIVRTSLFLMVWIMERISIVLIVLVELKDASFGTAPFVKPLLRAVIFGRDTGMVNIQKTKETKRRPALRKKKR